MPEKRKRLPLKDGMLKRPRIDALLDARLENTLVLVTAGSGYGKTQAVAQYFENAARRLAWLSMTELFRTPAKFWEGLVRAVGEELPRLAQPMEKLGFPNSMGKFEAFLEMFAREQYAGDGIALVVDDYNLVQNRDIHAFFSRIIKAGLENFSLVLVVSEKPALAMGASRFDGGLPGISGEDLRFTPKEARELFELHGLKTSEKELQAMLAETEGWPLALGLIAAHHERRQWQRVAHSSYWDYVFDLFETEYYAGYEPDIQQVLVRLSLLPCFPAELIREIEECEPAELLSLLTGHMFVSYDVDDKMFTFHRMYREFLSLKQVLLPVGEVRRVFTLAAEYLLKTDRFLEAFYCYRQCDDYESMLRILPAAPRRQLSQDEAAFLMDCLNAFPQAIQQQHPFIDFTKASLYLYLMEVDKAERLCHELEERLRSGARTDDDHTLLGEVYVKLADICMLRGVDGFAEYYRKGAQLLPEGCTSRDPGLLFVGNSDAFFMPDSRPGALRRMVDTTLELSGYAQTLFQGSGYGYDMLFAAEAAHLVFELDAASEHCYHAIHKAQTMDQHDIICNANFLLARIALLRGDYARTAEQVEAVTTYISSRELAELYDLRECITCWFYTKMGDHAALSRCVFSYDIERYISLPLLAGRYQVSHVFYLIAMQNYVEALSVIGQVESTSMQTGVSSLRLTLRIAKAECHLRLGDEAKALAAFWDAYEMAHENGIITPFIEFGNIMRRLIDTAKKDKKHRWDGEWLEEIHRRASTYSKYHRAVMLAHNKNADHEDAAVLTKRETEVLRYLSQGLSRGEIAEAMRISENGVKKHITGIFNKLGAINRADAMVIATGMGLLGKTNV